MHNLLWLKSGCCGGDSISLMNLDHPDLYTALKMLDIKILWFPSLSFESNLDVRDILDNLLQGNEKLEFLIVKVQSAMRQMRKLIMFPFADIQ